MMMTGFLGSLLVLRHELIRKSMDGALAETLAVGAMIGGLVGAKIYFIIEAWSYVLQDPSTYLFTGAGFTFFGGLLGGFAGVFLIVKVRKLPFLPVLDAVGLTIPIGYGLGRIGCQLAGDGDYGSPTDLPWGMPYPDGLVPTLEHVHPTPVYEALSAALIFCILWRMRTRMTTPGGLFCTYLILAGVARFIVEFVRINPSVLFGLSDAQIFSFLMVMGGSVWLFASRKRIIVS
jgi:phosphatidylglycerol---prolipoprotein diacylglyceryl transferase